MRPIFISFAFRYSIRSKVFFRLSFTNKHCAVKPSQYQFKLIRKAGQEHLTQFVESDSQPSTNTRTSIVSNKLKTSAIIYAEIPQLSRRSLLSTGYLTTSMLPSPKQWATTNGKSKAKAFFSNARQPEVDFLILTKNRLYTRTDTKQYKFVSINAYSKGKNASLPVDVCLSRRR